MPALPPTVSTKRFRRIMSCGELIGPGKLYVKATGCKPISATRDTGCRIFAATKYRQYHPLRRSSSKKLSGHFWRFQRIRIPVLPSTIRDYLGQLGHRPSLIFCSEWNVRVSYFSCRLCASFSHSVALDEIGLLTSIEPANLPHVPPP